MVPEKKLLYFLEEARKEALKSTCLRAKCGAVIVKNGKIIGRGFNSPPGNVESERRCYYRKNEYNEKVTDKTCCMHAEQRAIFDALKKFPKKIKGSGLYFVRVDDSGNILPAGNPYCTICSKSALDVGISKWILYHEKDVKVYDAKEYSNISFNFSF